MMTPYERMLENQYWIKDIEARITGLEKWQARGMELDPTYMAVEEDKIDYISPMSCEEDRVKLNALRTRLNEIRKYEKSRPRLEFPLFLPPVS